MKCLINRNMRHGLFKRNFEFNRSASTLPLALPSGTAAPLQCQTVALCASMAAWQ